MATPHVAGVVALYLQGNPGASPATVSSAIISAATTGKVTNAGRNSPNRLLFTAY
jgi:subtilisin family serine protease